MLCQLSYTDGSVQTHSRKRASCRSLLQACYLAVTHQAKIRMRSHRLLQLNDNKSAASFQQASCKLIVKTLSTSVMQVVAGSLRVTSLIFENLTQLDDEANRFDAMRQTSLFKQDDTNLHSTSKIYNLH